ncbi:nanos homolog 2 [Anabas testudineus]|uniref:nanos homolog 2 n=1 Tax=Anabas testudineus TaxID=64144 RepID=UPI000E4558F6|nr:nanos homolog 2 [Anabas testudineus]
MTTRRPVGVQCAFASDRDCFDMWHDYMNLGRLVQRLCSRREVDHGATEGPQKEPTAPWSLIQASSQREDAESSPASSISDTSSGTSSDYCRFCKQNGESPRVYRSHKLKSDDRKVICPVLRSYTCPICGATGDHAHTIRYCPKKQRQEDARMLTGSRFW